MPPTPVEAATVEVRTMADIFRAVGSVEAREQITIAPEVDGRVVSLPFTEGERVSAGALLARLDDTQVRAELDRASALLARATADAARVESLVRQRIAPEQALDDARATLRVAQADVAVQTARLDKTEIRAPFSGVIGSRFVSPGAWLRAGDPIASLAAVDVVKVIFAVPERLLGHLAPDAPVSLRTTADPEPIEGRVRVVDPMLDARTRTVRVIAEVGNPRGTLHPGMSADVELRLHSRENARAIPSEAVFVEGDQAYVFAIAADGAVARRAVTLGVRTSELVEALSGLEVGERVVRTGHQKLHDGARVMAVGDAGAETGAP